MGEKIYYTDNDAAIRVAEEFKDYIDKDMVFICVGTDRLIADSIGPIVGTNLINSNLQYPVYGTIEEPIHAMNLVDSLARIYNKHPDAIFIGIDSSTGTTEDEIGYLEVRDHGIFPGAGAGKKDLPKVGDFAIVGFTNAKTKSIFTSNMRLNTAMGIAKIISDGIVQAVSMHENNIVEAV